MKIFLTLLTGMLFHITACAQATTTDDVGFDVNGFVTTTAFSDNDWYDNSSEAAIGFDLQYHEWAIRGQLAEPYSDPIKMLVLERAIWMFPKQEMIVQIGRFPRLDSFYNSVTDSPGTAKLAMLPLGEYNRRMLQNRSFTTIDGIRSVYTIKSNIGLFKLHGNYGVLPVENQCGVQREATKKECRDGYAFTGDVGNFDYGVHYEQGNWSALAFVSSIKLKSDLIDPTDKTSKALTSMASRISFDLIKLGLKYDNDKSWIQTELLYTDYRIAGKDNQFKSIQTSQNIYILGGYNWNENWSTYAEYSYGKSNTGSTAQDRAVGVTYVKNDTTVSLEYHSGVGSAWKKYFAPDPRWDSFVFSITQRF